MYDCGTRASNERSGTRCGLVLAASANKALLRKTMPFGK